MAVEMVIGLSTAFWVLRGRQQLLDPGLDGRSVCHADDLVRSEGVDGAGKLRGRHGIWRLGAIQH